jgi:hypothetical protein
VSQGLNSNEFVFWSSKTTSSKFHIIPSGGSVIVMSKVLVVYTVIARGFSCSKRRRRGGQRAL